jgi:hypothetical protein
MVPILRFPVRDFPPACSTAENLREGEHGARGFQKVVAEKDLKYAIFGSGCGSALLASAHTGRLAPPKLIGYSV